MKFSNDIAVIDNIAKKIKKKLGNNNYFESNLGMVKYNVEDDCEVLEITDLYYNNYKIISNPYQIVFLYENLMFNITAVKSLDRTAEYRKSYYKSLVEEFSVTEHINDGCKVVFVNQNNIELAAGMDDEWIINSNYNSMSNKMITNIKNSCINSVNGAFNNFKDNVYDIMNARNKVKKKINTDK